MCANKLPERHPLKAAASHELRAANVAKLTDEQWACWSSMVKEIDVDWTYGHIVALVTRFVSTEMKVSSGLRGGVKRVDTLQTGSFQIDNPILGKFFAGPDTEREDCLDASGESLRHSSFARICAQKLRRKGAVLS